MEIAATRRHVVRFELPRRACASCWTVLDVVTIDTTTVEAHSHGIVPQFRACYGCGDEVAKSAVVAVDGRCVGCGWRGPLAEIAWRDSRRDDGVSAPLCLLCRDGLRVSLRQLGWGYEMRALAA